MKKSIRRPARCPRLLLPQRKDVRPGSAVSCLRHVMKRKTSLCRPWGFDNLLSWTRSDFHGPFPCRSQNHPAPCTFGCNCGLLKGLSVSPTIHMLKPNSQCDDIGRRGFGEVIRRGLPACPPGIGQWPGTDGAWSSLSWT